MDTKSVEKIAKLARLYKTKEDKDKTKEDKERIKGYVDQLGGILALVEQMKAVDTKGVLPMAHPQDMKQRLREDIVTESDQHKVFQALAPKVEAGLYLVPIVIKK